MLATLSRKSGAVIQRIHLDYAGKLLYLAFCGAGPAKYFQDGISEAVDRGWKVKVIATQAGAAYLDTAIIKRLTGSPLKITYSTSDIGRCPPADAMIVAAATFNTVNKLALGISDTYALDRMHEAIGRRVPFVLCPYVDSGYAARKCYQESLKRLVEEGVELLTEADPHKPGEREDMSVPWEQPLDILEALLIRRNDSDTVKSRTQVSVEEFERSIKARLIDN